MFPASIDLPLPGHAVRHWAWSDKPALIRHANNRNVSRALFDRFPFPYTEESAERWLAIATSEGPDIHRAITFDGEAIGGISAMRGSENARYCAEIGYWIGEAHWGRGVMTATVIAFCNALFEHTELERIEAGAFITNPASHRVLEKAGFAREGVLRRKFFKDGEFVDDAVYALLRRR
jgi:[ribosomal protein S5]-alanine N-acetyltransferase